MSLSRRRAPRVPRLRAREQDRMVVTTRSRETTLPNSGVAVEATTGDARHGRSYRGKRRAAVALNDATATTPGLEPEPLGRRRRDLGDERPDADARAVAHRSDGDDGRADVVQRESSGTLRAERDVPRIDGDVDRARRRRRRSTARARRRARPRSARLATRPTLSGEQRRAGEARDERVARHRDELGRACRAGGPCPSEITPTRSRERRGVLEVVRDEERRQPEARRGAPGARRGRRRACARRAPRAARRAAGPRGRARARGRARPAGARRRRARRRAPARGGRCGSGRAAAATRSRRRAPKRTLRDDVEMREERVLLEDVADAPVLRRRRRCRARVSSRTMLAERDDARGAAGASPATTRSTVVFPAPDGPTSASVSPRSTVSVGRRDEAAKRVGEARAGAPSGEELDGEEDQRR